MKVLTCNSNTNLSTKVANFLGIQLVDADIKRFADKEIYVDIKENVRGEDIFVIQSTSYPANDHIMELLITIDALRRASAKRITAVIPYFGYARQDRKVAPRTPISAKLVANIIETSGADRILSLDLHASQIQGFFDIPVDNLYASPIFAKDIKERYKNKDIVVVSPDVGGLVRAREIAKRIGADLAIVDKRRPKAGESEVMNIIGDVSGRGCIIVDDIVDSGGTLCNAAKALKDKGADFVCSYITHGVLSGNAIDRISNSCLQEFVITNSIDQDNKIQGIKNIRVLDVAPLVAEAISNISLEKSVSTLFN